MADISIDRLSLNMPGSAQRGEYLARKIAEGLADPALSGGMPADVSSLNISLHRAPDESDDALADHIVAEIIRQLDRIA
jgi:hypothetical protein